MRFFDGIYIFDNASTDGTWEIVRRVAHELPQVVAWKSDDRDFNDGIRGEVFNVFSDRAECGDWWCRLDADEIYLADPRLFLRRVPAYCHVVWSVHLQFYFTELDEVRWASGAPVPAEDFSDMPRHYLANNSEPRWFRHRPGLQWGPIAGWPDHLGLVYRQRLPLKHFQWRSPQQMQVRLDTRHEAIRRGYKNFPHNVARHWGEVVRDSSTLHEDDGSGDYVVDPAALQQHLERPWRRALKRFMHGSGLWP